MIIIVWSLSVIPILVWLFSDSHQPILYLNFEIVFMLYLLLFNEAEIGPYATKIYTKLVPSFTLMFMTGPCKYYRNYNLRKLCKFTFETFKQRVIYVLFSNVISKQ